MNNRLLFVCRNVPRSLLRTQKYSTAHAMEGAVKDATQSEEVKKTMIGNWIQYWKNVFRDYKSVAFDLGLQMKNSPGKSSLKLIAIGSLGYCAYVNPSKENYFNELLENQLRILTVPSAIRSKNSMEYIHRLESYQNLKLLRHQNFGIFSIVFYEDYNKDLEVYKKQCDYLHPSYLDYLKERIVDVGFLNHWYFMNKAMEDYDVNPEEWEEKSPDPGS